MRTSLLEKLKESVIAVLPISIIILFLHFFIAPLPIGTLSLFLTGAILLIIGMSLFTLGVDKAMMPMGELIGSKLTESRKPWLIILSTFILGVVVTVAEPDLQVLTKQVPAVPDMVLVAAVGIGVGVLLVLAILRILFQIKISYIFLSLYFIVFVIAFFASPDYLAVSFDAGGVTTGPITVPFILALGAGISTVRGGNTEKDSFGLCAICSIGPIITVLILGLFFDSSSSGYAYETVGSVNSLKELVSLYGHGLHDFFKESCTVIVPIIVIFLIYQLVQLKLPKSQLIKIGIGIFYTLIGLTIFLAGVNIGFMPAGTYLGNAIASLSYNWILLPLSLIIGCCIVAAEPAVHVLNNQIEEITSGAISKKMMMFGLSIGVGAALVLAMIRIMTFSSIWYFLLPGYTIALILTFFVPDLFTAIAFDSGGVASGTMSVAFLLPFAMGVSKALGGNIMTDAFGIVAMVAMMPLITVQIMGLIYSIKLRKIEQREYDSEDDILILEENEMDQILKEELEQDTSDSNHMESDMIGP